MNDSCMNWWRIAQVCAQRRREDIDRVAALIRNDGSPTPHHEVVNCMRAMMDLPPLPPEAFDFYDPR